MKKIIIIILILVALSVAWHYYGNHVWSFLNRIIYGEYNPNVPIMSVFNHKIVYTTDQTADTYELQQDCRRRRGRFNFCGNTCATEQEMCAQVCAFTCEF